MIRIINKFTNSSIYSRAQRNVSKIQQSALDLLPDMSFNKKNTVELIKTIGSEVSSAENRLILGVTALMSQPFIDAHNRRVDEETRRVSVCRTIAKIIAGTLTGYAIRKGCIKGIKALSQVPGEGVPKIKTLFTPKGVTSTDTEAFKQYQNAMGTVMALIVMLITNFAIDAPLTKFLTNKFVKKSGGGKQ